MIFRDAFYHADPHPGNLMLMPGGVVGVLDCGMVGRLDEELAEGIESVKKLIRKTLAAVPPIVIVPLTKDGCIDTRVDLKTAIRLIASEKTL